MSGRPARPCPFSHDELEAMYCYQLLSLRGIAAKLPDPAPGTKTVARWLRSAGITVRPPSSLTPRGLEKILAAVEKRHAAGNDRQKTKFRGTCAYFADGGLIVEFDGPGGKSQVFVPKSKFK